MDYLDERLDRILESQKKAGEISSGSSCDKCNDVGFIFDTDEVGNQTAKKCICRIREDIKSRKSRSGLWDLLGEKTFENYKVSSKYQQTIKQTAIKYLNTFKKGFKYNLILLGQSGVGKTHISAAVADELLDMGEDVKYFTSDEILQSLSASRFDEENYNKEFYSAANAGVLIIDDLFKSSITNYYNKKGIKQEDFREMFKIINYRYNRKLPTIVSSEIDFDSFMELDQAMIGRLTELATDKKTGERYLVSITPDTKKNYRIS